MKSCEIEKQIEELIDYQKEQLLKCGRRFIPHLTADDVLQPNDFPELEFNPHFRYEEGILAGIQMVQILLQERRDCGQKINSGTNT